MSDNLTAEEAEAREVAIDEWFRGKGGDLFPPGTWHREVKAWMIEENDE